MAGPDQSDLAVFCRFLNENRILIADTSSASRSRLAATLVELGVRTSNLILASNYEDAEEQLRKSPKPKLVLCDYMLGKKFGLDLLQSVRTANDNESVFILVTGNTSQSAVARAAEEDVDSFILKPYTLETLKTGIVSAVIGKIRPSDYMVAIRKGKDLLFAGKTEEALRVFEEAMKLDPQPTLAFFYKGYGQKLKNTLDVAESSFKEGLTLNKIHYKCLVGLFDLLMEKNRVAEAYDVVKRIAQYFPANPKRLGSVLRLAILTEHYEDMEGYYRLFTQLDMRTDELVSYMCSALVVCGKYYLQKNLPSRAIDVFEKAATSCGSQSRFLKFIIESLLESGQHEAAVPFFERYQALDPSSTTCKILDFLMSTRRNEVFVSLKKGQELLKAQVKDPIAYRFMIECCARAGLNDAAENVHSIAVREFPDKKADYDYVLATYLKPRVTPKGMNEKGVGEPGRSDLI